MSETTTGTTTTDGAPPGEGHRRGHGMRGMRDPWAGKRALLAVADVTTGYHHDSISHTLATIERLGRESGAFVTNIRTESQLITRRPIVGVGPKYGGKPVNARGLSRHDALLLLPSGSGTLTDEQKKDLLAYVHDDGKGLIVGHAAILAFPEWPEFHEMCGARMGGEFMAECKVLVDDPSFPGADAFGGPSFLFEDQHPVLKEPYSKEKVHVIMRLCPEAVAALPKRERHHHHHHTPEEAARHAERQERGRRADGDYPVVWTRQYGKGRVFHFFWGHLESTWDDPRFQKLVLEGIKWAMGPAPDAASGAAPGPGRHGGDPRGESLTPA